MKPTGATKEATGHSPLPWRVSELFIVSNVGNEPTVARATGLTREEARANAQLIVTAVNERERLRELVRDFRKWLIMPSDDGVERTAWPEWVARIDAALNEVEG